MYFTGDYMTTLRYIEDILHGCVEIQNFSLSVEKYFMSERSDLVNIFQHEKRNFVSPSGHVILYLLYNHQ